MLRAIKPVDPDRFSYAVAVFMAGASGRMVGVKKEKLGSFEMDGQTYEFTDSPLNMGVSAVLSELQPEPREWTSLSYRLLTLTQLVGQNPKALSAHLRNNAGDPSLSKVIVHAAASAKLRTDGKFDVPDIVRRIAEIIRQVPA
jgi:hypothetical protein